MRPWQERLKEEVPRTEIPNYLTDLQALVAALRRHRDDLRVPGPDEVRPFITDRLAAHPDLTVAYITDARYAAVVAALLQRDAGDA